MAENPFPYNTRHQGLRARSTGGHNLRYSQGAPRYYTPAESGYWDGSSRPSFAFTASQFAQLKGVPIQMNGGHQEYQCCDCLNYFPAKSDRAASTDPFITIDHISPWQPYISDHAAPDDSGSITREAARDAYNDLDNLQMMCNPCNSSKNGYSLI